MAIKPMGKKKKKIPIPQETIQRIREDLSNDGIRFYNLADLPDEYVDNNLLHPDICSKCDSFVVAISGSNIENREYMFIAGLRNDYEEGKKVTDIDPIGMIYDCSTETPAPSGIALFHGDFDGRTEEDYSSAAVSVTEMKEKIVGEVVPFSEAPQRFTNAIHFVAKKYRDNLDKS